jgi:ureidoglycolate lyase
MRRRTILLETLTVSAFAPFGDVITVGTDGVAANQGSATRFNFVAALQNLRPNARANVAVFRTTPRVLPMPVRLMERHPHSSQMFVPMRCTRYAVLVAPNAPDGGPDLDALRAFECTSTQGVNYRAGVWHHPMIALDAASDFVMLAWEDGSPGDCEERWHDDDLTLVERDG